MYTIPNMKIAIISDTHDNHAAVTWILDYLKKNNIATIFHGGDLVQPGVAQRFADQASNFYFVFGNNDGEQARTSARMATKSQVHQADFFSENT